MERRVSREILDSLDPETEAARASRCDLRCINRLMGHVSWFIRRLSGEAEVSRCLEVGAGDGSLAARITGKTAIRDYVALDLQECGRSEPGAFQRVSGDLLEAKPHLAGTDILLANLILHHLNTAELARFGADVVASSVRRILAAEPRRHPVHLLQLRAGRWIGFNRVTLHDGTVSIHAGFRGAELPRALGLDERVWRWTIQETWLGSYRMEAVRI